MSHPFLDEIQSESKTYRKRLKSVVPGAWRPSRSAPNVEALTAPEITTDAQANPARAKAEADGFASFGRRTWFLVEREGRYRAVETMDDAPGWALIERMKR